MTFGKGEHFLNRTPKVLTTKEKTGKLDYVKIRNFYHQKITKRVSRHVKEWEKFAICKYRVKCS